MKNKSSKVYLPKWVVQKMIDDAAYNAYKKGIMDATNQIKEALKKDGSHI